MKKNDTKKIIIKNKEIQLLNEEGSEAGQIMRQGAAGFAQSVKKIGQGLVLAWRKLFDLYLKYPVNIMRALFKGESLRAVHLTHSARQRNFSNNLNNVVNSLPGVQDLNSFINIAAPGVRLLDVAFENAGILEEAFEDFGTNARKDINLAIGAVYNNAGVERPEHMYLDEGTSRYSGDLSTKIKDNIMFHNSIINIAKLIDKKIKVTTINSRDASTTNIDAIMTANYKEVVKAFNRLKSDTDRTGRKNDLFAGNLTYTVQNKTEKIKGLSDEQIELFNNLQDAKSSEYRNIFNRYKNNMQLNIINGLEKNLEYYVKLDTPDTHIIFETQPSEINDSYTIKINNKELILEKEDNSDSNSDNEKESEEDTDKKGSHNFSEDELNVLRIILKRTTLIQNAIAFNDSYIFLNINTIKVFSSFIKIKAIQQLIEIHENFIINKKLDINLIEIKNLKIEDRIKKIKSEVKNIENLINNFDFDVIEKKVPELEGSKDLFLNLIKEQKKETNKEFNDIVKLLSVIRKNAEKDIKKDLENVGVSPEKLEQMRLLTLCKLFFDAASEFNAQEIIDFAKESSEIFNQELQDVSVYKKIYNDDNAVLENINAQYIKNCISIEKISDYEERVKELNEWANSGKSNFKEKIKKISEDLDASIEKIKNESNPQKS
jgi:hypothetical protein